MTKKQRKELNDIVAQVSDDKRQIAANLVEEIVFLYDTMGDLKKQIRERGAVELFEQGKQRFMRESPAMKSYTTAVQRYGALYKQLIDLMPKTAPAPPESELLKFIQE